MKFSLSWLKEHLDFDLPIDLLAKELVSLGLEVEEIIDKSKGYEPFIIAEIKKVSPHPNADRLRLCEVSTGYGTVTVVCGDPKVFEGMKTVFAPIGTYIPGLDVTLKKAQIRGVDSNGMLCSTKELKLGEDQEGIMNLPTSAKAGTSLIDYFNLKDSVIDVAVTPNRSDWLGVRGIARDLAARGIGHLKPIMVKDLPPASVASPIKIVFDFNNKEKNACPFFAGRLIQNIQNKESPEWLQNQLKSIGLRPISALVDITNFLTHDICRPLHVFDADKIKGNLHLRLSKEGEELKALDHKVYKLDDTMTVITDDSGVLSLGGVIGGISTSCTMDTKNVFIEAALFDPIRTAQTGRKLGILSDARYRFERGIDPESTLIGLEYATQLILDICGGEISDVEKAGQKPDYHRSINLRPKRFQSITGVHLSSDRMSHLLQNLGCEVNMTDDSFTVIPPSWRLDLQAEIDLIEDILRLHGYEHIPTTFMPQKEELPEPILTPLQKRRGDTRRFLASIGMTEIVTYSFMSQEKVSYFGDIKKSLVLANPISADLDIMRPSIFPNLLDAVSKNKARGLSDLAFFEIGPVYFDDTPDGQAILASGVRSGKNHAKHWLSAQRNVDVFDAKGDVLALFQFLNIKEEQLLFKQEAPNYFHPGRSGSYYFGGKTKLASFGELHPKVLRAFDIDQTTVGFEIFLDKLPFLEKKRGKTSLELSPYQSVTRDFAFILSQEIPASDLIKIAKTINKDLVESAQVFDVYQGDKLPLGKKSIALTLKLQPKDRTLKEDEIEALSKAFIEEVQRKTSGQLRDH